MKYCIKCNIPESFPNIEFENDLCFFCRSHDKKPKITKEIIGEENLLKVLSTQGNGKYDCIVPVSGGKDSSYILYYIVRKLNLKPLAVFFDNGYITDYAKENIHNICSLLNVDLEVEKISSYRLKMIKEAWYINKYWDNATFGFCGNCENNIRSLAINSANKHQIKYMLWGSTDYENSADNFHKVDEPTFRNSYGGSGNPLRGLIKFLKFNFRIIFLTKASIVKKIKILSHYIKYLFFYVMDNVSMNAPAGIAKYNPYLEISFIRDNPQTIYFYEYIKYDPESQIKLLIDELSWKAPSGRTLKMDCKLHDIGNYLHYRQKGITDTGFKLSVLVRNNLLARSEALVREENEIKHIEELFGSLERRKALYKIKSLIEKNDYAPISTQTE